MLGFPTQAARRRAGALQDAVQESEFDSRTEPDPDAARIATIHARQDMVLLVSMQFDIHRQLVNISRAAWVVVVLLALLVTTLRGG